MNRITSSKWVESNIGKVFFYKIDKINCFFSVLASAYAHCRNLESCIFVAITKIVVKEELSLLRILILDLSEVKAHGNGELTSYHITPIFNKPGK